ncbi:MAG: hypothetical protein ACFUZC_23360 [Chthoniobacteraceae bacterium]
MRKQLFVRPLMPVLVGIAFPSIAIVVFPASAAQAERGALTIPEDLNCGAAPVAADTILQKTQGAPKRLPAVTAEVIISQRQQRNAPAIIQAVVAAAPLSRASDIAAAIGAEFATQPQLVQVAPEIAAAFTRALLGKLQQGASDAQVRIAIAESVGSLTVELPGTVQANYDRIVAIGRAVAGVLGPRYCGMAPTIVAATSAALKASAGASDVTLVVSDFQGAFKNVERLAVAEKFVRSDGKDFKDVKEIIPLDPLGPLDPIGAILPLDPTGRGTAVDPVVRILWCGALTAPEN